MRIDIKLCSALRFSHT